jgi:hypothetical protein
MMHKLTSSITFTSIRWFGWMRRQSETPTTWRRAIPAAVSVI